MSEFVTLEVELETLPHFEKKLLPEDSTEYLFDTSFRCDTGSCGAQAYIRTTFKSGNTLYWCTHHAREAEDAITPLLSEWYSEENRLKETRHKGDDH